MCIRDRIRSGVLKSLEEFRYQGDSQVLPDGDFTGLGSFEPTEEPVLEITMSRPDSYYLRGFTGSVYTGTGWTGPEAAVLWENRNLFYLSLIHIFRNNEVPRVTAGAGALVSRQEHTAVIRVNASMDGYLYYLPDRKAGTAGMPTQYEIKTNGKRVAVTAGANTVTPVSYTHLFAVF